MQMCTIHLILSCILSIWAIRVVFAYKQLDILSIDDRKVDLCDCEQFAVK